MAGLIRHFQQPEFLLLVRFHFFFLICLPWSEQLRLVLTGLFRAWLTQHMGCRFTGFDGGKNNSSSRICDRRLRARASVRGHTGVLRVLTGCYLATRRANACRNSLLPRCPLITCRSFPALSKSSSVTCLAPCLLAKLKPLSVRMSAMT